MDRALASEASCCGFKSLQARLREIDESLNKKRTGYRPGEWH